MPAWQSLRRAATILLNAFCKTGSWKLKRHLAVRHQNYLVDRADLDLRKLLSICYSSNTVMTLSRHIRGLEWTKCRATVGREVVGGLGIEQHLHFSRKWFLVLLICWQLSALLVQKKCQKQYTICPFIVFLWWASQLQKHGQEYFFRAP